MPSECDSPHTDWRWKGLDLEVRFAGFARSVINFIYMQLKHESITQLQASIYKIIRGYLDESYRIFFFGSRVEGTHDEHSDIDIGIEGPEKIPHSTLAKIQESVNELPILYSIDMVDFKRVSPDFKEVALGHTKAIQL